MTSLNEFSGLFLFEVFLQKPIFHVSNIELGLPIYSSTWHNCATSCQKQDWCSNLGTVNKNVCHSYSWILTSQKNSFISFNERTLKVMKNAFYFILIKDFFVLKILKFLSWLFGHVEKSTRLKRYKVKACVRYFH